MRNLIRLCLFMLVVGGCSNEKRPDYVLKPAKMQDVLWDMFLAQSWAQQHSADSTESIVVKTKRLSGDVFKIHGITEHSFTKSYQWYLRHPESMNKILDSLYSQKSRDDQILPDEPTPPTKLPLKKKENIQKVPEM